MGYGEEIGDDEDNSGSGDEEYSGSGSGSGLGSGTQDDNSYYSKLLKSTRNPPITIRISEEAAKKTENPLIIAVVNSNNKHVPPVPESFSGNVTGEITRFLLHYCYLNLLLNYLNTFLILVQHLLLLRISVTQNLLQI